jgi:hypothetical protein
MENYMGHYEYDDNYLGVETTYASLRIQHDLLVPEAISILLQLTPSWGWPKGIILPGKTRPTKTGIWGISSEGHIQSREVRRHIDWIIDRIQSKTSIIHDLQEQRYTIDVFCFWSMSGTMAGLELSPHNCRALAELNIPIGFDIYASAEDHN